MKPRMSSADLMRQGLALQRSVEQVLAAVPSQPFPLNKSDIVILGLMITAEDIETLKVHDPYLCSILRRGLTHAGFATRVTGPGEEKPEESCLSLISWADIFLIRTIPAPTLIFGFSGLLPLKSLETELPPLHFLAFSSQAAALWNSGLAWLTTNEKVNFCESAMKRLCIHLSTRELDPLWLFERVQELKMQLEVNETSSKAADVGSDRIAKLERELTELRRSGLIRQQLLIAEASHKIKNQR